MTNIGKEAQTLDASSQYLYGSGGQRYDADTEAAVYLGVNQTRTFLEDINPGNSVNGVLIYDIPKGQSQRRSNYMTAHLVVGSRWNYDQANASLVVAGLCGFDAGRVRRNRCSRE